MDIATERERKREREYERERERVKERECVCVCEREREILYKIKRETLETFNLERSGLFDALEYNHLGFLVTVSYVTLIHCIFVKITE